VKDVPDFALVAGVPARRIKWVGRLGVPLEPDGPGAWVCPRSGQRYVETPDPAGGPPALSEILSDSSPTEVPQA